MEKGTTKLWGEFIETLPLIKDELSFKETDQIKTEVFERGKDGLDYTLEYHEENGKTIFSVSTRSDSDDLDKWNWVQYWLRVDGHGEDENFSKNERFLAGKGPVLPMQGWLTLAFYQRNLRVKPDLDKLFGGLDIRIISLPDYDHHYDFITLLKGAAITQYHVEVLRFRHVHAREPDEGGVIQVEISYAIKMSEFWAVFPFLGAAWSSSAASDLKGGEKEFAELGPAAELVISNFDFDKEEFMRFVMRYETTFRSHLDYSTLQDSINMLIDLGYTQNAKSKTYYEKEINKIEDSIWEKDYPHAIRDLRALIEEESRELLRSRKIPFGEKDELHELKSKMIQNKLIEGRLSSWFDAFVAFGNKSAHENYPTKELVNDSAVVRNRTDLTILIGKELLSEILEATNNEAPEKTGSS